MDIIEKYPNKPWKWEYNGISSNPKLTMDIIEKYPNKPWKWDWLSENPNITMEMIEKYPNKPWDWCGISMNPNITIEFIEKYINKINFQELSINTFTYENKQIKKKEAYWLLEKIRVLNKLENLVILEKYM
jgi:disulfide oxidoreductase YuzD